MSKAYSNPVFQQDLLRWQKYATQQAQDASSCLRCHAPVALLTGDTELKNPVSREGVTCTVCHKVAQVRERDGQHFLVMDPRQIMYGAGENKITAGHEIRHSEALTNSSLCAGCHHDVLQNGMPLENTYHEWRSSAFAEHTQCTDCHMPVVADAEAGTAKTTHRSHRFPGGHASSELLTGAAKIQLMPVQDKTRLVVKVSNVKTGHNFPTGGAHPARLVLTVRLTTDKGEVVTTDTRQYEFTYLNKAGLQVNGREAVASWLDTALKPLETRTEQFELPPRSDALQLNVSLVYELIPASMAAQLPADMVQQHYRPVVIDEINLPLSSLLTGEH